MTRDDGDCKCAKVSENYSALDWLGSVRAIYNAFHELETFVDKKIAFASLEKDGTPRPEKLLQKNVHHLKTGKQTTWYVMVIWSGVSPATVLANGTRVVSVL
jgi:hypothetical protein